MIRDAQSAQKVVKTPILYAQNPTMADPFQNPFFEGQMRFCVSFAAIYRIACQFERIHCKLANSTSFRVILLLFEQFRANPSIFAPIRVFPRNFHSI